MNAESDGTSAMIEAPLPINRRMTVSVIPRADESPVQAIARQLEIYRAINTLIDMTFIEGEDYGIIKDTDNPSLRIPGIEKACGLLGLHEVFNDIHVIREYDPDKPFFYYEVECVLYSIATGQEVARGQAVCHTREESFTRQEARKCPKCGTESIFRSKDEGWYCWKKKDGCGANFAEKDPAIISQKVGNVFDAQLVWNGINRARKVANKRAISSAIRRVAMLSGHFVGRKGKDIRYLPDVIAREISSVSEQVVTQRPGEPSTARAAELMGSGGSRRLGVESPGEKKPESAPEAWHTEDVLIKLADKSFNAKFIGEGGKTGIEKMLALIAPRTWSDFGNSGDAALAVKAAFETLQRDLKTPELPAEEVKEKLNTGNGESRRIPTNGNGNSHAPDGTITVTELDFDGTLIRAMLPNKNYVNCGDKTSFLAALEKELPGWSVANHAETWEATALHPQTVKLHDEIDILWHRAGTSYLMTHVSVAIPF